MLPELFGFNMSVLIDWFVLESYPKELYIQVPREVSSGSGGIIIWFDVSRNNQTDDDHCPPNYQRLW